MAAQINFKKIMIFGRPGSGKSTFAYKLSKTIGLPLYHLDKHFFTSGWVERDYQEFMQIQKEMVQTNAWIIDGNSVRSLETRWEHADLVLYFNYHKIICLFRLLKRLFFKANYIDDRAINCKENLNFKLIKYMWTFEERVNKIIFDLKEKYPAAQFIEINSEQDLKNLTIFS